MIGNYMADYSKLLTKEQLEFQKRVQSCTTIEELKVLSEEMNLLNENSSQSNYRELNMTIEEFTQKYDLTDIKDLQGKYGF